MTENERNQLYEKYTHYMVILDTYSKLKNQINMSDEEYENHINDILDEINELKRKLNIQKD